MLRHNRNKYGIIHPYPQRTRVYPPQKEWTLPPPPQKGVDTEQSPYNIKREEASALRHPCDPEWSVILWQDVHCQKYEKLKKGNYKKWGGIFKKKDVKVPKSSKRKSEMEDIIAKVLTPYV